MATITIRNKGMSVTSSAAVSILNALLRDGVAINHVCGGKAQCGTCRIQIVEGDTNLNPMNERERIRLAAIGNPPGTRLACQTYAFGDIVIDVPPL